MMGAAAVCVEFVDMMPAMQCLPEAARMLGYLQTTGDFGARASRTLVAGAAAGTAANPEDALGRERAAGRDLDGRQALGYMRQVLTELAL